MLTPLQSPQFIIERQKAKAVPAQEPPQRLLKGLSTQVKQCPIFLNVMSIVDNGTPWPYKAMRGSEADLRKKATDDDYTAIMNPTSLSISYQFTVLGEWWQHAISCNESTWKN